MFHSKNKEWRDLQLVSQITFGSLIERRKVSIPLRPKQLNMHVSCIERPILFTLYKVVMNTDFKRKLTISGGQKKDQRLFES